ncbi:hypothetical protein IWQ56_000321 [Coemansia nantahalensis]|uniref:Uncharacterized protein n=1 Tax=Coemansia nantahalensis TaxID=2789366 RepID=A0ACC1K7S1_9FUNG|nr:hypothetical protein IWQ56_000321 [Coemansia nantahalensis]KAJ2775051.1 hypothetical protein IWQ57_000558 [Coemansia nantahalensis]
MLARSGALWAARWRRCLAQAGGPASYATGAKAAGKAPRTKYLGLSPLSPAVDSMAAEIGAGEEAVDVKREIDARRFSAADLFDDLPKYYTSEAGNAASEATGGDLAAVSRERALEIVREMRQRRAAGIEQMFRQDQLKAYLAMHGQRVSGTKRVQVERIITSVWGITLQSLAERAAAAERKPDDDGVTMRLNDEAAAQIAAMDGGALAGIAKEFGVEIELREGGGSLRVSGRMAAARAALSVLREKLAADATVEVRLERYGTPRALEPRHAGRICNAVHHAFGGRGTVTLFDSELFVRGRTRADSLDIQQALVDALVEPARSTLFVVVPSAAADAPSLIVAPAADLVSKPRTFVPEHMLMADQSDAGSVLDAHTLFRRRAPRPAERLHSADLATALREWAAPVAEAAATGDAPARLSFQLGRVMLDMHQDGSQLHARFHCPAELLEAIDRRAPLYAFSASASPLKWLHSQSAPADAPAQQLVLTFRRVAEQPDATPPAASLGNALPALGREKLVARLGVAAGQIRYDQVSAELVRDEQRAAVAILPGAHDLEATVARSQPVDAADGPLVEALRGVVRQLGDASAPGCDAGPCRHGLIDTPRGQFALAAAELDSATHKPLAGGLAVWVHQVWDIVDRQRYSRVVLRPQPATDGGPPDLAALLRDTPAWARTVRRLLELAVESPADDDAVQLRRAAPA